MTSRAFFGRWFYVLQLELSPIGNGCDEMPLGRGGGSPVEVFRAEKRCSYPIGVVDLSFYGITQESHGQ